MQSTSTVRLSSSQGISAAVACSLTGAAQRSAMNKALQLHYATSPAHRVRICSQCCAEARLVEEYRPGVGRFTVRVCLKCAWRDDVTFLVAEPEVPTGPGSCSPASTLAYLKQRLACVGAPLDLVAALDPIGRAVRFANWKRHYNNAFELVEAGVLVQDGTGTLGAPAYRLAVREEDK